MGDRTAPGVVRVGLVSDTHDRLPDGVARALAGVTRIVHAGDVTGDATLTMLETIAPVTLARGNCDDAGAAARAPSIARVSVGGAMFVACHDAARTKGLELTCAGASVVVSGHTHVSRAELAEGVWRVNPGSPSEPRGGSAATVGIAYVLADGTVEVEIVEV